MIDIEKEREAFEAWHYEQYLLENPSLDIANAKHIYDYSHKNAFVRLLMEAQFIVWQSAKAQAVSEMQQSKQAEIDDLKAQINALEESRMTWREYAMKIESGEYELVKKAEAEKCVWRENALGIWDTACDQDYVSYGFVGKKPSDIYQYCSNCGKKIEEVSFEEIE